MTQLTDEEKQKIYEEEKARRDARQALEGDSNKTTIGAIISMIGGALIAFCPSMPWVTLGIIQANGYAKTGDAYYLLILGALAGLIGLAALSYKGKATALRIASYGIVVPAILAVLLLIYFYVPLSENVSGKSAFGASASIGYGYWLGYAGAVIALIGASQLTPKKKKDMK